MNLVKLRKVRDAIAAHEEQFDMGIFWDPGIVRPTLGETINDCRTVGCIAGWAAAILRPNAASTVDVRDIAQEELELTELDADSLFYGDWAETYMDNIKVDEVLRYLNSLLEEEL